MKLNALHCEYILNWETREFIIENINKINAYLFAEKKFTIQTRSSTHLDLPKFHKCFLFSYFVLNEGTLLACPVFNLIMYTNACYLNGKFTSQKLALNLSNILALGVTRCHQHPCQQVRSQLRTEVRARDDIGVIKHCEPSQPEQALEVSHCAWLWAWVPA